jgi:hypothetical protein
MLQRSKVRVHDMFEAVGRGKLVTRSSNTMVSSAFGFYVSYTKANIQQGRDGFTSMDSTPINSVNCIAAAETAASSSRDMWTSGT